MADQNQVVEIPLLLENVLRFSINQARDRMLEGEVIEPFTALAVGDTLFFEVQEGNTPDECFAAARATVSNAKGARTYGFCYDGFLDTDMGQTDAIIAQGGMPGEPYGHAIGLIYKVDKEGNLKFHNEPIYVGPCQNYMLTLESIIGEKPEEPAETPAEAEAAEGSGDASQEE